MKKSLAALGALAVAAPGALAAGPSHYLKLAPNKVAPGKTVRVYGSVGKGCAGPATIYSKAFTGATSQNFAGVPSVTAKVAKNHKFSIRVKLSKKLKKGKYAVGGRCGGGVFGRATLTVKKGGKSSSDGGGHGFY